MTVPLLASGGELVDDVRVSGVYAEIRVGQREFAEADSVMEEGRRCGCGAGRLKWNVRKGFEAKTADHVT